MCGAGQAHLAFYQALEQSGQVYRVPGLLASSFEKKVAIGFMARVGSQQPKVLFTIKLKDPNDFDGGCKQVNFLEKTTYGSEREFLFSAYSTFRVLGVTPSADPANASTPWQITIEAATDNSKNPEDVPSAPWY